MDPVSALLALLEKDSLQMTAQQQALIRHAQSRNQTMTGFPPAEVSRIKPTREVAEKMHAQRMAVKDDKLGIYTVGRVTDTSAFHTVNLSAYTCSCDELVRTELPCVHMCHVCFAHNLPMCKWVGKKRLCHTVKGWRPQVGLPARGALKGVVEVNPLPSLKAILQEEPKGEHLRIILSAPRDVCVCSSGAPLLAQSARLRCACALAPRLPLAACCPVIKPPMGSCWPSERSRRCAGPERERAVEGQPAVSSYIPPTIRGERWW